MVCKRCNTVFPLQLRTLVLFFQTAQSVQELAARRNKYGFTPLLLLTKSIAEVGHAKCLCGKFSDVACSELLRS